MKQRNRDIIARDIEALQREVDAGAEPAHISARGYGGVVAMHFARRFPERVASLELIEPADFISLFEDGLHTAEARLLRRLHSAVVGNAAHTFGRWRGARDYVNFWSGSGAWKRLGASGKARCAALAPRFAAELDALMSASAGTGDLSALTMPVTIRCRTRARRPIRRACELLCSRIPHARYERIATVGVDVLPGDTSIRRAPAVAACGGYSGRAA